MCEHEYGRPEHKAVVTRKELRKMFCKRFVSNFMYTGFFRRRAVLNVVAELKKFITSYAKIEHLSYVDIVWCDCLSCSISYLMLRPCMIEWANNIQRCFLSVSIYFANAPRLWSLWWLWTSVCWWCVKGQGPLMTYWLHGKKGFNKPLPAFDK